MKKPVIGVLPLWDRDRDSMWMLPGYFRGLEAAGALPVMLSLGAGEEDLPQILDLCDGLLFTGGQDLDPRLYGQAPIPQCGELCPQRDALELALLRAALDRGLPLLGICRGLQLLNVGLGGTLWQDLPSQRPGPVAHRMKPPYDGWAHTVILLDPMAARYRTRMLMVNSLHHQAVRDLAPGLEPLACSEDGLVEGARVPDHPFAWGVQWHPEFYDPRSGPGAVLFRAFVQSTF